MIKAIIFDWGGVLESDTRESFTDWLIKETGLNRETIGRIDGYYYREMNLGHITLEELFDKYKEIFDLNVSFDKFKEIFFKEFRLNYDLLEFINDRLVGKYRLYVLSNNNNYIAEKARNTLSSKIFDGMFFSCEMGVIKPDAGFFEKVLSGIDLESVKCLFVDNRPGNTYIAEKLGMKSICFTDNQQFSDALNEILRQDG